MASDNIQLGRFLEALRAEGFEVMLNWEAPRWVGDQHEVRHYSLLNSGDGRKPAVRTFMVIDHQGDGYSLYTEVPNLRIADDVALILGTPTTTD